MLKKSVALFILFVFILAACDNQEEALSAEPYDIAKLYLEEEGYTILSHEKTVEPYRLTKNKLRSVSDSQLWQALSWQAQPIDPDDYIGKEIYGENFIIENHPHDHWESGATTSLGETHVYVLIVDGEVIGGISSPVTEEIVFGCCYTLHGENFEDLHPNVNWRAWADTWIAKYSN